MLYIVYNTEVMSGLASQSRHWTSFYLLAALQNGRLQLNQYPDAADTPTERRATVRGFPHHQAISFYTAQVHLWVRLGTCSISQACSAWICFLALKVSLFRRNWCVPGCMELGLADLGDDGGVGCGAIGDLLLVRRSAMTAMHCDLLAMLFVSVDEC